MNLTKYLFNNNRVGAVFSAALRNHQQDGPKISDLPGEPDGDIKNGADYGL
jgi:hypothetical protein